MPRVLKSSILVNNMVEAFKNRTIFKFIKWTNGEVKALDELFAITESREFVKSGSRWVKQLAKIASKSKIPFIGKGLNPTMGIIITSAQAYDIQRQTHINPYDSSAAKKMMDKHHLLVFGIYDTEEKMLSIMYNIDTEFTQLSLRTMLADVNKTLDLKNSRK